MEEKKNFAMGRRGMRMMLLGLLIIVAGFVMLSGGGVDDPEVFNYEMFNVRRLVLAPLLMLAGIVVEIVAIMCRRED